MPYRIIVMAFLILGSILKVTLVWELADLFNDLLVLPNLIALIWLSKLVSASLKDYETVFEPAESSAAAKAAAEPVYMSEAEPD